MKELRIKNILTLNLEATKYIKICVILRESIAVYI